MKDFPIIPVSANSLCQKKPLYGIAINDADYKVQPVINGKKYRCKIYEKWLGMLRRCFCEDFKYRNPTYKDCSVCDEWLRFSNFRMWVVTQDWVGKELDKDLLNQGNKIYSPSTCLFISKSLNSLLLDSGRTRGSLMIGACFEPSNNKYKSSCRVNGVSKHIGRFKTEIEAHEAYKEVKYQVIARAAKNEPDPIRSALLRYVIPKY